MLNFNSVNITAGFLFLGLVIGYSYFDFPFLPIVVLFFIWLLLTMAGSAFIGWNYHFKSYNNNLKTTKNHIAITFDDGPHPEYTPKVLALLEKYNAKATFFCIGKNSNAYPEILKSIINQGHIIGNHTYSHSNTFGFFSTQKVISELEHTNTTVKKITGLDLQLYRPAFGVTNPKIKRALKHTKMISIGWNKRSLDTTSLKKKNILKRITKNLKRGDVILLHDSSEKTIIVLEQLLLFLQQQNMEAVTIDSLFNLKAYA